jgi:predicted O-linked N-acetylglucosamine transferase (SPINDLY family)
MSVRDLFLARAHAVTTYLVQVINLGGYTKGARNDVFAARPCPVQIQLIGYPSTLGAGLLYSFIVIQDVDNLVRLVRLLGL